MESPELYGIRENYIYCKFESSYYQAGLVGLRLSREFEQEELMFLKTVANQLFHVIRLMKVIEDLQKAQASIRLLAEYDPLSLLYNRNSFEKLLEKEIDRADRSGEPLCLLFIDVDNLKVVNDTYGYNVGDFLLKSIAEVIKKGIRKLDIAGRLGGDEFGIILPRANKKTARDVAERLRQEIIRKSLVVDNAEIHAGVSISIVCYPLDAKSKEEMISIGEGIMYAIKKEDKGSIKVVDETTKELYATFRRVERDILDSLERGLVEVFLQDIVDLKTKKTEAFEGLMRLVVKGELLPAGNFIHMAEQMGLIHRLDLTIIEKLFQEVSQLQVERDFLLFINISPRDLTEDFMKEVMAKVKHYKINPERIVFEITEREAIQDIFKISDFIKSMKNEGFRFAIDDFGSGYASYLYIKYLPVDFLKIEGEFIKGMKRSDIDKNFIKSMLDIARGFGIKTIAEYVEDKETFDLLVDMGVDYAQGYYIGKPGKVKEKLITYLSKGANR